ncbi:MAG: hypothetical protein ACM3PT_12045 [Deltaproteobacteria bacterium]
MKISIAFLTMLLFFLSGLKAQDDSIELKHFPPIDTFRLERYALPDINHRALDMFFDFNSRSNQNSFYSFFPQIREIFFVSPTLGLRNYSFKNNIKKQVECRDFLEFGYYFNKTEDLEVHKIITNSRFTTIFTIDRSYRYYDHKNRFFEIAPNSFVNFDIYNDWDISLNIDLDPGFFYGWGRIEDVTDVWHTNRILKDLQRENLLTRIPDGTELTEISERLSQSRYKRIFDHRIWRKDNLKLMDEVLTEKGLIKEKSVEYYTTLSDMLDYGVNNRRFANKRLAIGLVPKASFYILDEDDGIRDIGISAVAKFDLFKPISMTWQFDLNAAIEFGYSSYKTTWINENRINYTFIKPILNVGLKKYISSRSYASTDLNVNIDRKFGDKPYWNSDDTNFGILSTTKYQYYFSPKTGMSVDLILSYRSDDFGLFPIKFIYFDGNVLNFREGFGHSFSLTFTHKLF